MTPTQRAAMEQALKALRPIAAGNINSVISDAAYAAATSLIAALAEPAPVQEPVADVVWSKDTDYEFKFKMLVELCCKEGVPVKLYAGPFDSGGMYWHDTDTDRPAPQAPQSAPVQETVAWWKQYPDGSISVVESRTFLADDAVATGWSALRFADTAPQAQQPAPPADVPMLTDEEVQQLHNSTNAGNALIRLIEQIYRQKAGLQ